MTLFRSTFPIHAFVPIPGLLLLALVLAPAPGAAQGPLEVRAAVAAGPGTLPAALRSEGLDPNAMAWGATAELRLAVGRVGPFSVEGRAAVHTGQVDPLVNPNDPGTPPMVFEHYRVQERPTVGVGPQASWDVRLRADVAGGAVFTLGGGLMTEGVRLVAGSLGHRWGDGRFGVDLEAAAYEVRWERAFTEILYEEATGPEDPPLFMVGETDLRYDRRWHPALGLRLSYTVDLLGALRRLGR